MVADLRELFTVSLWDVRWRELPHLLTALLSDPRSRLQAVLSGWAHPISREAIILADIHDLQHQSKVKRGQFKAYPRPWPDNKTKLGGKRQKRRTAQEVQALLRPKVDSSQSPS